MALFYHPLPFHPGEISLHYKLHISQNPDFENPTIPYLSPLLSRQLQLSPLIALGTLDCQGWPVTTLLGKSGSGSGSTTEVEGEGEEEEEPLAQPLGRNGVMGIKAQVEGLWDPVVEVLVGGKGDGDGGGGGSGSGSERVVVRREEEGKGRMISGLTIDLERRKRVKFFGRMVVGALGWRRRGEGEGDGTTGGEESIAEMQLVLKVEQRYGGESIFSLFFISFSLFFLQRVTRS